MYELENDLWLSKKKIYEKIEVIKFFFDINWRTIVGKLKDVPQKTKKNTKWN